MDGVDFIVITGTMNGVEYGYMFADLDSNTSIFLTICSNTLGPLNQYWFNYGSQFVASARK